MLRVGSLARLAVLLAIVVFVLHFLSSAVAPQETYNEDGWSERLGLDHYADFEAGVANRLGDGFGRVREGLGALGGGLGWGKQGRKLGSLYEVSYSSWHEETIFLVRGGSPQDMAPLQIMLQRSGMRY
jgi:hypothetical protein